MADIIWSPQALEALDSICLHIASDSESSATNFANKVMETVASIAQFPLLGSMVPEYELAELRERIHQNYRIIYRIRVETIEIVVIYHGARQLPTRPPA